MQHNFAPVRGVAVLEHIKTLPGTQHGVSVRDRDGDEVFLGVFDTAAGRLFFVMDLHDIEALERYLMYFGAITKGNVLVSMLEDLADLFEQSAASGTPIRALVGENPVEFAETFLQNCSEGQWINKERERLIDAIDRVAGEEA